jgi:hypothetical protein
MELSQKRNRRKNAETSGTLAKQRVLESYPTARLIKGTNADFCQTPAGLTYHHFLVTWDEQSVEQFMVAYANSEEKAWKKAWKTIQKEMLEKFENL